MKPLLLNLNKEYLNQFWHAKSPELLKKLQIIESKETWVSQPLVEKHLPQLLKFLLNSNEEIWVEKVPMHHVITLTNYLPISQALYLFLWMDSVSPRYFASILINAQVHRVRHEKSYTRLLKERLNLIYQTGYLSELFSFITYGTILRLEGHL